MDYPEHEKLKGIKVESQAQGEFLDWLMGKGYVIARYGNHPSGDQFLLDAGVSIETLLAEYYGIDLIKLEAEKRQMLKRLR